jgi:N-acetylmuramoyl-L-alanine amidase
MLTLKLGSRGSDVKTLQHALSLAEDGIFGPVTEETVKAFQKEHGLSIDGIVGPNTWAALGVVAPSNRRTINKIILHCSATPEGEDFSVEQIRQMHLARGFADIGYHWYITRDGKIHKGRDESKIGAHTIGQNAHSIGVCYCGGCPPRSVKGWDHQAKDTRTLAQKYALRQLVRELQCKYPNATVHGHYEFANKACPSFKICDL